MSGQNEQLNRFKSDINLTEYAATQGYEVVKAESSRNSVVMESGGDKVIIAKNQGSGHWMYFSVRDDTDNGTIIDFVQNRQAINLREVRVELCPWIGESSTQPQRPEPGSYIKDVQPVSRDIGEVIKQYGKTTAIDGTQRYLETDRAIPKETLQAPRFAGKIRADERNNAIFPHHNVDGLCGFEKKNRGFTGFASGGAKGIWASAANKRDHTLVFTESGIDALSYYTLYKPPQARYMSVGGEMNPEQPELIERAIQKLPEGGKLVLAVDNDKGGDGLLLKLREIAANTGRTDLTITDHRPPQRGLDWNKVLQQRGQQQAQAQQHTHEPEGRSRSIER